MKTTVTIFWSDEDKAFVAIDPNRPGCSAIGEEEVVAMAELLDARAAWDIAKKRAAEQPKLKMLQPGMDEMIDDCGQ